MCDRGHGRDERRAIPVMPAPEGSSPTQRRCSWSNDTSTTCTATRNPRPPHWGLTCLSATQADPERLATLIRGHWGIESLRWVRDVTFDEDRSQLRKGSAPQVLAGLRNLAVGALHTASGTKIESSLRWISRNRTRTLDILGQAQHDQAEPCGARIYGSRP
jgi:predicted transposase YbfD/YdcC